MTKFYHQGASGPEEWVLVPAGGMSTDTLEAAISGQHKTEPTRRGKYSKVIRELHEQIVALVAVADRALADKDAEIDHLRAALAAAQAGGEQEALAQIVAVCDDNMSLDNNATALALKFVREVAIRALRPPAAQAAGTNPGDSICPPVNAKQAEAIKSVWEKEYQLGLTQGFAAGIEAAAKLEDDDAIKHAVGSAWTDDKGITLRLPNYPGDGFKPANGAAIGVIAARKRAARIRALRPPAAPVESETLFPPSRQKIVADAVAGMEAGINAAVAPSASAPAGAPSEEEIARAICCPHGCMASKGNGRCFGDRESTKARAVLALLRGQNVNP